SCALVRTPSYAVILHVGKSSSTGSVWLCPYITAAGVIPVVARTVVRSAYNTLWRRLGHGCRVCPSILANASITGLCPRSTILFA
ncbi:MAG: hypothetical protein FE78DRAFT_544410, partial [Acidomyces sp. 'richmondensis']